MKTLNDVLKKIYDYVYIEDSSDLARFFDDLSVMLGMLDLTADQICGLINLLSDVEEDLLRSGGRVIYKKDYVEEIINYSLYPKLVKIPEKDLHKVVSVVYNKFGDKGLNGLMIKNFADLLLFKLFVLIFIKSENLIHKEIWLKTVKDSSKYFEFVDNYGDRILLMFGWVLK